MTRDTVRPMKPLLCLAISLAVLALPGCKPDKPAPLTRAALLDPPVVVIPAAFTMQDVADREANASCPNKSDPACGVYLAARYVMGEIDGSCKTRAPGGACIDSTLIAQPGQLEPLWIQCNITDAGCSCAIKALGFIRAMWADKGCNGTGRWDAFYECPNGRACGCMNSNDECASGDT